MNLTLSADEELIQKMRNHAAQQGSSLNQMIRDYMEEVTGSTDLDQNADEFVRLATQHGGASSDGFVFDRDEAHRRETGA